MSFENPQKQEEFITPEERNEAIAYFHLYINEVNPMGGNDSENDLPNRMIEKLMSGQPISRAEITKAKESLGDPYDKSSNYR